MKLGRHFVDMVATNSLGGTDYVEVGKMLKNGQPVAWQAAKISEEIPALGANDRLIFVDEKTFVSESSTSRAMSLSEFAGLVGTGI